MQGKASIHLIGIGGIGMSALARYYRAEGRRVSGSDSAESQITAALKKEGIKVTIGHKKGNIDSNTGLVIYNRAIAADNPEVATARRLGLRIIPYAEALGELTEEYPTVAITGSHGKSTTTALAALALIAGGLDPTVLVGTNLKEFGGKNIRVGQSHRLLLEADDFGGAFWEYSPAISIVTNIDREHLDFYKNLGGVKKAFLKFIAGTVFGGALILNRDDKNLFSLEPQISAIAKEKELHVIWYSVANSASGKNLSTAAKKIKKIIKIPGEHNVSNAMAVYELGKLLKIPEKKILTAIGSYTGAWRRMEYRGELGATAGYRGASGSLPVFDDYAHHPTEIKATLQAFEEKFPNSPLVCIFQPHQTKRLQVLFKEFTSAFARADALVLIPSYTVAGRDKPDPRFTAERLAAAIQKRYPAKPVFHLAHPKDIKKFLKEKLMFCPNACYAACFVMMGAGDIVQYTDLLVK